MQKINQLWYLCFVRKFIQPDLYDYEVLEVALKEQRDMLREITLYYWKHMKRNPEKEEVFSITYECCKFNYAVVAGPGNDINMSFFDVIKYSGDYIVSE